MLDYQSLVFAALVQGFRSQANGCTTNLGIVGWRDHVRVLQEQAFYGSGLIY